MSPDEIQRIAECLVADFDIEAPGGRGSVRAVQASGARGGSPSHGVEVETSGGRGSVRAVQASGSHGGSPSHGLDVSFTIAEAYAIQAEVARLREQRGERIIGYKVGCTSKAIQEQLGVREPIFGRIFDTGCFHSGASLSHACFANLAVEGELAVRLGNDLAGPAVSEAACRQAIEAVFPVIELHHYVIPEAWPPAQWLVASSGMHAGFVFEDKGPGPACSGSAKFARSLSVRINDDVVGAVEDPSSLVSPIESLRRLTGQLAHFGLQLFKGQVILTGSPMRLFPVAAGSRIVVEAPPLGASGVEIVP